VGGDSYDIPRILFVGPRSGDVPLRIGIFAGIHGDELATVHAVIRFISFLEEYPELAAGYCLSIYPLCNPTGFEDNTRHSRGGKDLNREFWQKSAEPEVRLLETELVAGRFNGIISLHINKEGSGFNAIASGETLTKDLIAPALKAVEPFLPLDTGSGLDGPRPDSRKSNPGRLSAPPAPRPKPFEIELESPRNIPMYLTEVAFVAALQSILANYREFIAYARNF
jgi:predicted deacylase